MGAASSRAAGAAGRRLPAAAAAARPIAPAEAGAPPSAIAAVEAAEAVAAAAQPPARPQPPLAPQPPAGGGEGGKDAALDALLSGLGGAISGSNLATTPPRPPPPPPQQQQQQRAAAGPGRPRPSPLAANAAPAGRLKPAELRALLERRDEAAARGAAFDADVAAAAAGVPPQLLKRVLAAHCAPQPREPLTLGASQMAEPPEWFTRDGGSGMRQ